MKKLLSILFLTLVTLTKSFGQAIPCPTVNAQVGTGPSTYICAGQCANLSASVSAVVAQTNSYVVSSIPYYNFPYAGGAMAVWNADDLWGQVIPIGFNFCYFGNSYNQLVVGTNGVVTFNLALAGGGCNWFIGTALPSAANMPANSIACPFRDIVTNGVDYAHYYVTGTAPCRAMVIYWQNIPLFSCVNPRTWTQLVLYEGTNIIDVNIQNSSICAWNGSKGIVGIQNLGPTTAYCPPGRNFPSIWAGINESWRFTPAGASTATWSWSGPSGVVGVGPTVAVCPTITTTYTASCVMGCTGPSAYQGTVQVIVNPTPTVAPTSNAPICQGSQLNILANGGGTMTAYSWTGPGGFTSVLQNPTIAVAQPSNTGTYSLVATNNFTIGPSCVSSGSTSVTVVPVNQVTVTPSFTLCQGSNLNLTAVNTTPPTSYSWTGPGFVSALQNPTIPNVSPVNSGNYVVTASFTVPNIPLICTSTAVSNVSVVATSPVTVTMPANICEHTTANLTANSNPVALSYVWSGPNGYSATGTNPTINNILSNQTGMYNVVATWAIGSVSCTISNGNMISVIPVKPVTINAPITVCYPGNVALTASSPGASSYSWNASNGYTTTLQNPYFAAPSPSLSGTYTVITTYTNGSNLICYNSNTTQVTINPILTFTLPPYTQICSNVVHIINGPLGASSYTWMTNNTPVSNLQNLILPSAQVGNAGVYTLIVSLGPCQTSATTRLDVLSPISYTITPGDKTICEGDKVTLLVGAGGGSENYAYNWNPYNYLVAPTGSIQTDIHPQGTTIYNVTCYDIACPNYTIGTSFKLTVNRAPVPNLGLTKISGCEPLCLTYNSHTQNTAESIIYDFGSNNILMADSFVYCLDNPGSYNLKISTKGKNGCVGTYTMPYTIDVWPNPHADIKWSPDPVTTINNHVTFEPTFGYGPVVKYQWEFLGTNADTSSVRNPERIYDKVGKFQVMLITTTDKGCVDTAFKVIDIRDEFNIFIPNTFTPNGDGLNDVFNVKGLGLKTEGYSMEIYDRWGTMIYLSNNVTKGWDGTVKGTIAENGVYVYKIKALGANGEGKKEYVGHVSLLK